MMVRRTLILLRTHALDLYSHIDDQGVRFKNYIGGAKDNKLPAALNIKCFSVFGKSWMFFFWLKQKNQHELCKLLEENHTNQPWLPAITTFLTVRVDPHKRSSAAGP